MRRLPLLLSCFLVAGSLPVLAGDETPVPRQTILVVVGASGSPEYAQTFGDWVDQWQQVAQAAQAECIVVGQSESDVPDRDVLAATLNQRAATDGERLWLILIGHGTFDGTAAKFNLRGPDVTADQLATWLAPVQTPVVVVNCASSSGSFINAVSGPGRIVVTATKSGYESNYARFGEYFAAAITDPLADLDKDDQVSLLEAYLAASRRVEEFYQRDDRLASEHALLDDNCDGLGTPASWFRGLRATRQAKPGAELDGLRAHQVQLVASDREARMPPELRRRRDALELQLEAIRERKQELSEDEYFAKLETVLLELARIYQSVEDGSDASPSSEAVDESGSGEVSSSVGDTTANDNPADPSVAE